MQEPKTVAKKQNPFAPSNKQSDLLSFDKGIHKNRVTDIENNMKKIIIKNK